MRQPRLFGTFLLALATLLATAGSALAQQTVTVTLSGQATGTATLTAVGPTTTRVEVRVSGLPANTTLSNHIHSGTCASLGGTPHHILANLTTDAQGNASATTTLNAALSDLAGLLIIAPHVEAGGTPLTCGAIAAVAAATPVAAAAAPATAAAPAVAGGPAPILAAGVLGALGLFAIGGGLFLRRR